MNYMQILSGNLIKIQSLIASGFVCATQSGAIKDRIPIRLDKIRKLYFDSAHNKTVQHKL